MIERFLANPLYFLKHFLLPKNNSELPKNLLFLPVKCLSNAQISNHNLFTIHDLVKLIFLRNGKS